MNKLLRGEVPSDDEDDFGDDDGEGEGGIDLFAPVDGLGGDDDEDDSDEEEGDLDVGGMMYRDFFDPPARSGDARNKKGAAAKGAKGAKGKGKGKEAAKPALKSKQPVAAATEGDGTELADDSEAPPAKKAKRGVRFSDAVKVKEIPHRLAEKKRLQSLLENGEEVDDEEMLKQLVAGSDSEEDGEDDEELEDDEDGEELSFGDDAADMDLDGFGDEEMDQPGSGSGSGDDVDDDDEEEQEEEDDIAEGAEAIDRFKTELFDDEPEEDDKSESFFFDASSRIRNCALIRSLPPRCSQEHVSS